MAKHIHIHLHPARSNTRDARQGFAVQKDALPTTLEKAKSELAGYERRRDKLVSEIERKQDQGVTAKYLQDNLTALIKLIKSTKEVVDDLEQDEHLKNKGKRFKDSAMKDAAR